MFDAKLLLNVAHPVDPGSHRAMDVIHALEEVEQLMRAGNFNGAAMRGVEVLKSNDGFQLTMSGLNNVTRLSGPLEAKAFEDAVERYLTNKNKDPSITDIKVKIDPSSSTLNVWFFTGMVWDGKRADATFPRGAPSDF